MNFKERLELFPPVLCRLLARQGARPLSSDEIAVRSAMAIGKHRVILQPSIVEVLSRRTEWVTQGLAESLAFMHGCGTDLTDGRAMVIHDDYLKKVPAFNYLRKHKDWNSYYLPLLVAWRKSYPVEPPTELWRPIRNLLERLTPIIK